MPSNEHNATIPPLHPIAELYGKWAFNFMVDVATAIAHDFVDRPQHYRHVPNGTKDVLASFRSLVGAHPDWPNAEQRIAIFRGVLSSACLASASLREAALVYIEHGTASNEALLLDAFQDTATSFRNQLKTLEGHSLDISSQQIGAIFDHALQLFGTAELVRVFDLPRAPEGRWPLGGDFSAEGAYLVTEAVRALEGVNVARAAAGGMNRPLYISMSQGKFEILQRVAHYGGLAMSELLTDAQDGSDPRSLIGNIYKWTKALQRVVPNIPRVWKDQQYRLRLTDLEWGMVDPHPSGEFSLPGPSPRLGGETYTVNGEICCCSGDLGCSSNCEISPNPSCINCGSLGIAPAPILRARGPFGGGGYGGGGAGGCV
ncbi:MAG TPA: hypothetical protein VIH59_31690 [Candidatus Tectomicrobia bacterium]|jgi:hypothetical protein